MEVRDPDFCKAAESALPAGPDMLTFNSNHCELYMDFGARCILCTKIKEIHKVHIRSTHPTRQNAWHVNSIVLF